MPKTTTIERPILKNNHNYDLYKDLNCGLTTTIIKKNYNQLVIAFDVRNVKKT